MDLHLEEIIRLWKKLISAQRSSDKDVEQLERQFNAKWATLNEDDRLRVVQYSLG